MAVITQMNKSRNNRTNSTTDREPSEFDGFWINAGVNMEGDEGEDSTFVRLPRGIAVSDLQPRRIYDSMSPDFAAEASMMNQIITLIQEQCKSLEEGESIKLNMELQLYRKQEETEQHADTESNEKLNNILFGK